MGGAMKWLGWGKLILSGIHFIAAFRICCLDLLPGCQTGVSSHHHHWISVHLTLLFWTLYFLHFMFSSFLDSTLAFVEHISSNFLRKYMRGKSFGIVQVCKVCLPFMLMVWLGIESQVDHHFLSELCKLFSIVFVFFLRNLMAFC